MRRVVVTGVGCVSPCGVDTESTWEAIVAGKSGIDTIKRFDASAFASQFAGECLDFDPEVYIEKKRLREGDRFIHLAVAASSLAWDSSGLSPSDEELERFGTIIGVGMSGLDLLYNMSVTLKERGPRRVSPYFIPAAIANLAPGQVSMRFGLKGPNFTTTSACSSGAHAIGEAARWIQHGGMDRCLAGGSEAAVTGLGVGGFCAMRALSTRNDDPAGASRPFDKGRDGFVIAEGAATLVLEELEAAKKRGANILAEITGYGATSDAYHLTQPAPEAEGAGRAIKAALADGGVNAEDIDYINAHATSTPLGDAQEAICIRKQFENSLDRLSVSSTKSMTGHLLGAAGGLEALLTVLAVSRGVAPPTINVEDPDDAVKGIDLVPGEARDKAIKHALSNSFGFGGTNVSLLVSRYE